MKLKNSLRKGTPRTDSTLE